MRYFFLLLVIVPAAEIGVLIYSGNTIGLFPTIALIILTGILGTFLAKQQGLDTIRRAQQQLQRGQMPGDVLIDGVCVIIGGTLLLTPGFITDALGLFLLLPPTRKLFKPYLMTIFKRWMQRGNFTIIR